MSKIVWDATGEHFYETGVRNGVLYVMSTAQGTSGTYPEGVAWNGLTSVSESPDGAEANDFWADDMKYLSIRGAEDFKGSINAYTYPEEFAQCNGEASIATGVIASQQFRKTFGLCYRTTVGNDVAGNDYGYKLHIIYGATVSPSEREYQTINDSPEPIEFSWDFETVPVTVEGHRPTALLTIDSSTVGAPGMEALEAVLYGVDAPAFSTSSTYDVGDYVTYETKVYVCKTKISTAGAWDSTKWTEIENPGPRLPLPAEVITLVSGS